MNIKQAKNQRNEYDLTKLQPPQRAHEEAAGRGCM
jgi:hypothetical protein